jgi:glyoxylase-like metal-dependent hydrolase (beta-lactamase superfamily II)
MMIFQQLSPHYCRTYLIGSENDNTVILIDPVIDHFSDYLKLFKDNGYKLTHVIDTHTQADHISAGTALTDATNCEYIMHETSPSKCVSIRVRDGDMLDLNGLTFQVMYTPGHAHDAICLIADDKLFTGDTLFLDEGGAGATICPAAALPTTGRACSGWRRCRTI